eukprot:CAMPEP_0114613148 /NCGR_PEP_ID=MMETSP0168-20121206/4983_1 /TAXON_ID=95228 ORGANISM="Vannella sp., Strain DIVA3 517/6/12" /NCGR_SAMPLE_ID=MMETSP0168 /ASSEMBLY_ACC=CAM_ASM_000044 /LENGTH=908 /DNA_ID=CAMNT_0001824145 /DNA_START=21 /DNA_END=2744 /DNA_ORIENTATION=+
MAGPLSAKQLVGLVLLNLVLWGLFMQFSLTDRYVAPAPEELVESDSHKPELLACDNVEVVEDDEAWEEISGSGAFYGSSRLKKAAAGKRAVLLEDGETLAIRKTWYEEGGLLGEFHEYPKTELTCSHYQPLPTLKVFGRAAKPGEVAIVWPKNTHIRKVLRETSFVGVDVIHEETGEKVGFVIAEEQLPGQSAALGSVPLLPNKNLFLSFPCEATGIELLHAILNEPNPAWVAEISFGFQIHRDDASPDNIARTVHDISIRLQRTQVKQHEIVHVLNPYVPRRGGHSEIELTVVQRAIERAYNYAWERGIRVKVLAAVFEEDEAIVEYPYQHTTRPLVRHFLDHLGRKLPLTGDIFDRAYEDAGQADYFLFTNADIACLPHFYELVWQKYSMPNRTVSLLREQLDLDDINLEAPIDVDGLYTAAATIGLEHPGDDAVIIPMEWLPRIHYDMVYAAYPPVACTFITQLKQFGPISKVRARITFHLGIDTQTSAWLLDPETVFATHANKHAARMAFERTAEDIPDFPGQTACRFWIWCSNSGQQTVKFAEEQLLEIGSELKCQTVPPMREDDWHVAGMPLYVYGRERARQANAALAAMRENLSDVEWDDLLPKRFERYRITDVQQNTLPGKSSVSTKNLIDQKNIVVDNPHVLVEVISSGGTGQEEYLAALLKELPHFSGGYLMEPIMDGKSLSDILEFPATSSFQRRYNLKVLGLQHRWGTDNQDHFADMNPLFVTTFSDVVMQAFCRPPFQIHVLSLEQNFVDVVTAQLARGWAPGSNVEGSNLVFDMREMLISNRHFPTLLPMTDLDVLIAFNYEIIFRRIEFEQLYLQYKCLVLTKIDVERSFNSLASARDALAPLLAATKVTDQEFASEFFPYAGAAVDPAMRDTVHEAVVAFQERYTSGGYTLP